MYRAQVSFQVPLLLVALDGVGNGGGLQHKSAMSRVFILHVADRSSIHNTI